MSKKISIIIILIMLIISLVFLGITLKNSKDLNKEIPDEEVELLTSGIMFYAEVKEVYDNKILVDGLDVNNINFQGEFEVPILESTTIKYNGETIELTNLKVGDKISVIFDGEILETYPAVVKKVREIELFSEQQYQDLVSELSQKKRLINEFYTEEITKEYKKITELGKEYTLENAKQDKCFVIIHARVYNENLYEEFMQKYEKNEFAFIRTANATVEGDIIIYDIKYDNSTNKITVIEDFTRDEYMNEKDKVIDIKEYEKIGKYQYGENLYWVAYNGEINDEIFNTQNVKILAVIN
ncbi:MAG: DUF4362 domain-containing protein [Clostridia bacterium]|nr:DUF4362 domain-containing protein [Clostridia bacterium]